MATTYIVIPCYNERVRLRPEAFEAAVATAAQRLVFVDDGSTDGTGALLKELCARAPGSMTLVTLPQNRGKAEAVRAGLVHALRGGAERLGYLDADLALSLVEAERLASVLDDRALDVILGARVKMLGHQIERNGTRHYIGRVFATMASWALKLPVYDTQCGAKFFRRTPALIAAVGREFRAGWAFDVELLGRLIRPAAGVTPVPVERIREVPVTAWRDVKGSKVTPRAALRTGFAVLRVGFEMRRRRPHAVPVSLIGQQLAAANADER